MYDLLKWPLSCVPSRPECFVFPAGSCVQCRRVRPTLSLPSIRHPCKKMCNNIQNFSGRSERKIKIMIRLTCSRPSGSGILSLIRVASFSKVMIFLIVYRSFTVVYALGKTCALIRKKFMLNCRTYIVAQVALLELRERSQLYWESYNPCDGWPKDITSQKKNIYRVSFSRCTNLLPSETYRP